ncbi:non-specific lipid-transfer protein C6-like [Phragmites australis]|uniref:non-specific lipid-transfer protein C6-like n=1 Tax=Phragmites australis TaxID=29695 RepID=UPI002D79D904|nr:non-specific lipid-transfer protein C6-like [Phragmites australis]
MAPAAPSNKLTLIAFLVAFAVVAPNLQPSAAIRVEAAVTAVAPPPDGDVLPPLPPQPRECRSWLLRMMPCAGFLTNSSVYSPESNCCDGFNSMFTMDTVTCLCHVVNGDVVRLLPAPMHHMRMVELFSVCGHDVRVDVLAAACKLMDGVPPIDPPNPAPSAPSPSFVRLPERASGVPSFSASSS